MLAEFKIRFYDEALKIFTPPPWSNVAFVHQARDVEVVLLLGILKFIGAKKAVDNALDHLWRMVGRGANVLVEIDGLLACLGSDLAICQLNYQIQTTCLERRLTDLPSQNSAIVNIFFELIPFNLTKSMISVKNDNGKISPM